MALCVSRDKHYQCYQRYPCEVKKYLRFLRFLSVGRTNPFLLWQANKVRAVKAAKPSAAGIKKPPTGNYAVEGGGIETIAGAMPDIVQ